MVKVEKSIKNKNFYYWMGRISDILIYPIIILSLVVSFSMFAAKMENKVYMVGGVSIVKILSPSMTKSGFEVGHNVIIKSVNTDDLRKGDIISFYYYKDKYDDKYYKALITDFENLPYEDSDEIDYKGRKDREDAEKAKTRVYFHEIIDIYINQEGIRFFKTKGTSNGSADLNLTREDFVVGKYVNTPMWVRNTFKFFSSSIGMVGLVIVPLTILIAMQMLSLLEQISALMLEKKVLQRKVEYDCEECISSNIAIELRNFDKVYLYDIVEDNKKDRLHSYMWFENSKSSKKNRMLYKVAVNAEKLYKTSRYSYWDYWITNTKGYLRYKLTKMFAKAQEMRYMEKNGLIVKEILKNKKEKKK